ncbi:MAG: hypothetical protein AB7E84_16535 [Xanthobacteraceae bacterium]
MIGILCSALGLGHYVPGLLIREELASAGVKSCVLVFESFIDKDQRTAIVKSRAAYQRNSALVRIGQKLIPKIHASSHINLNEIRCIVDAERISHFVVLTGFWLHVLVELATERSFTTDLLHIDAASSPSWDAGKDAAASLAARNLWISNWANRRIEHRIDVKCPQIPFVDRRKAVLAHGGGWALGTYKDVTSQIAEAEFDLHIVLPSNSERPPWATSVLRIDPQWEAWGTPGEIPTFPPLHEEAFELDEVAGRRYHDLLEVSRQIRGVVSKPGGATILDCLASATPLIFVEPQGEHEARNAELWASLGLAISFDDWARMSFSEDSLYKIHLNLCQARARIPCYVRERLLAYS